MGFSVYLSAGCFFLLVGSLAFTAMPFKPQGIGAEVEFAWPLDVPTAFPNRDLRKERWVAEGSKYASTLDDRRKVNNAGLSI